MWTGACPSTPVQPAAAAAATVATPPQRLVLTPGQATVGTKIEVTATGLTPNTTVDLVWKTVQGGWVVQDIYHFEGKKYTEASRTLGQAVVDADGRLSTQFTVPEDYGGVHDVMISADGVTVAQGGIEVTASFEMTPSEGPVGTPIEVRAKGLGWRTMESTWALNWDNQEVGWISAADSRGSAVARIRAAGPEGDHTIKIYTGYMGQSYLNYEQAPTAYLPRPQFVFHTLPGGQVPSSYAEPYPPQPMPASTSASGAQSLSILPKARSRPRSGCRAAVYRPASPSCWFGKHKWAAESLRPALHRLRRR